MGPISRQPKTTNVVDFLVADVFVLDRSRRKPESLQQQLYSQLRHAILDGMLRGGTKLPASRRLAKSLGVSRNTVMAAYDQMIAEGFLYATRGAGTFVSVLKKPSLERPKPPAHPVGSGGEPDLWSRPSPSGISGLDLMAGLVDPELFPYKLWNRAFSNAQKHVGDALPLFDLCAGYSPLRDAIARHLAVSRGVNAGPEQVFITAGAAQSIFLISRVLSHPGDLAWMENPGYPVAAAALRFAGLRTREIPVDREGLNPTASLNLPKARLVYTTTSYQYPLGFTMSIKRRLDLLDRATSMRAWIIEDDYDGEFRYQGSPVPALFGLERNNCTIYLGTFSKTLSPFLRTSFLVVPTELIESFRLVYPGLGNVSAIATHAALAETMSRGHFARHVDRVARAFGSRRKHLVKALQEICGLPLEEIESAPGGLHIPVRLSGGRGDYELGEDLAKSRLGCSPLSETYAKDSAPVHGFLLGFTATSETSYRRAIRRLHAVAQEHRCRLALDCLGPEAS